VPAMTLDQANGVIVNDFDPGNKHDLFVNNYKPNETDFEKLYNIDNSNVSVIENIYNADKFTFVSSVFNVNNAYFLQNAFVYDPHNDEPRKISKCYDKTIMIRFDCEPSDFDNLNIENFTTPYHNTQLSEKIIPVDQPNQQYQYNGQTVSFNEPFEDFYRMLNPNFNPETLPMRMPSILGGDLYVVDSKELLNQYNQEQSIYDAFITEQIAPLYQLIIAYYANVILSFNAYFNKSTFIEILYNAKLYDKFFEQFMNSIRDYRGEIPEKLKVLIPLIFQDQPINIGPQFNSTEPALKINQIKNNFDTDHTMYHEYNGEYYEPVSIRRFLEMKFDPTTESNINANEKLVDYIRSTQGNKIIDTIMKFERMNLKMGAFFQFLKQFNYIALGSEVTSTKYTNDYTDEEVFNGKIPSDYIYEPFN
jgi:hypothetical protein